MSEDRIKRLEHRIKDKSIIEQSIWSYVREFSTCDQRRLCRTAVIDCSRSYTYGQMLSEWEHYARVFSALGINEENRSRVGIAGTISAEPLFSFYGLNMTGAAVSMLSYPDFLPGGSWKTMVEREKITDLILSDIMITPDSWPKIRQAKEELGLRNLILLHSRMGGPCTGPAELIYNEYNYHALKNCEGTVFMEDLLEQYRTAAITYGSGNPDALALITHTSGTTKGTRKPLPYVNRSVNTVSADSMERKHFRVNTENEPIRFAPSFDFSSFLNFNAVNDYLAQGSCIVLTFFGFMHPKFIRAIDYYKLNVIFTSGFIVDSWMQRTDIDDLDFSSLAVFSCGGSYLPTEKLKKYFAFLRAHGYQGGIYRGYGMSETGGAQLSVPLDNMEDILGYATPPENFRFQDETDGKFYRVEDGVRTGIMYMASDSLCMNTLDGEVLFEYTKIDGRDFICTNDLVKVNADGSISYAGRADKYFVNNEGVRFESGIVDTEMSKQPGIHQCAVVPFLDKRIHDTLPVLYVVPEEKGDSAPEAVRTALRNVFVAGGLSERSSLPSQFILVDEIPCNTNGKIDIYRITRERLNGTAYDVIPVTADGHVADIEIRLVEDLNSITAGTLPEGMGGGSAMGIYEMFNAPAEKSAHVGIPGVLKRLFSAVK